MWFPRWGDIPVDTGQRLGVASRLLGSETHKGGSKLLQWELRKHKLYGFSGTFCGYPDKMTFQGYGPPAWNWEPSTFFRKTLGWTKTIAVRSKKTAIGWTFKKKLGRPTLGPTERKMGILPPRSGIQVLTQGMSLQDPIIFQTDLGSQDCSYRGNVMEKTFGYWFAFPCVWGAGAAFPKVLVSREVVTEKWPPNKCFQAVWDSQHTECWESYLPSWKKSNQERVCFQASI